MISKIQMTMKSKEDLLKMFSVLSVNEDITSIVYNGKELFVSSYIWDLCGKEIDVIDNSIFQHGYDYSYTHIIEDNDGVVKCPIIYLKKEWMKQL